MTAKKKARKRITTRSKQRTTEKPAPKTTDWAARFARAPLDPRRLLALKLTAISRQLWLKFDQSVEKHGVTRAKWILIAAVARVPGATQRTIATDLRVTEVTAGRLIDRLCADGLLERRQNPKDRRSYSVYLTRAAEPVLKQLSEIANVHIRDAFGGLNKTDLGKLDKYLETISRNLGHGPEFRLRIPSRTRSTAS